MTQRIAAVSAGLPSSLVDGVMRGHAAASLTRSTPVLATEWRALDALHTITPQWQALAARALEPNVFYRPEFALPAVSPFGAGAGAVLVWSQPSRERLVGLFPVRVERRRYGVKLPILAGWTHSYAPLGVPLVDRDASEPVIEAFLDCVSARSDLPKILLLRFIPQDGPFASAFDRVVAARGGGVALFDVHQRALLAPGGDRARYLDQAIGPKRRKELRRQRRRLEESGPVTLATATSPAAVATAVADFLALEARGWKGRQGTAAARHQTIAHFVEKAITGLAAVGMARVDRLLVGGSQIAAALTLNSAGRAWFFKIAYDETLARASPGVQLTVELTRVMLADETIGCVDSCATEHHPMIDHLWRQRLALADRLVAIGPDTAERFAAIRMLETLRRRTIALAKQVRDRLRR
jgi:CelD/BcsL family acetyltransferase involved in cellulose biosynthesis